MTPIDDKDLLTKAATVAGIPTTHWNDGMEPYSSGEGFVTASGRIWNPLQDDGDAHRLAVQLQLSIDYADWVHTVFYGVNKFVQEDWHKGDSYVAIRRAIVRAAVRLGGFQHA